MYRLLILFLVLVGCQANDWTQPPEILCWFHNQCPPHHTCLHPVPIIPGKCYPLNSLRKFASPRSLFPQDLSKCRKDVDCSENRICFPTDLSPLAPGVCAPKNHGGLCMSNDVCKASQTCYGKDSKWGLCLDRPSAPMPGRVYCAKNSDCPQQFYCNKVGDIGTCKLIPIRQGPPTRGPKFMNSGQGRSELFA